MHQQLLSVGLSQRFPKLEPGEGILRDREGTQNEGGQGERKQEEREGKRRKKVRRDKIAYQYCFLTSSTVTNEKKIYGQRLTEYDEALKQEYNK